MPAIYDEWLSQAEAGNVTMDPNEAQVYIETGYDPYEEKDTTSWDAKTETTQSFDFQALIPILIIGVVLYFVLG